MHHGTNTKARMMMNGHGNVDGVCARGSQRAQGARDKSVLSVSSLGTDSRMGNTTSAIGVASCFGAICREHSEDWESVILTHAVVVSNTKPNAVVGKQRQPSGSAF